MTRPRTVSTSATVVGRSMSQLPPATATRTTLAMIRAQRFRAKLVSEVVAIGSSPPRRNPSRRRKRPVTPLAPVSADAAMREVTASCSKVERSARRSVMVSRVRQVVRAASRPLSGASRWRWSSRSSSSCSSLSAKPVASSATRCWGSLGIAGVASVMSEPPPARAGVRSIPAICAAVATGVGGMLLA